jgi:hypothetical protein
MKTFLVAVAGFLALAAPAGLVRARQDEPQVTLLCKPPARGAKFPKLRFDGTAPYPDKAVLRIHLLRQYETWAGGRIDRVATGAGGGLVEVNNKKFAYEPVVDGPGEYMVHVDFTEENQRPAVLESMKGKLQRKRWTFSFPAWNDELATQLAPKIQDLDTLAADALELIKRYDKACVSKLSWEAESKTLTKECAQLLIKVERSDARHLFPAAMSQVHYTVRSIQGTAPYFHWENGKFAGGKSYHADNEEIKTHRQEKYSFENLRRYIEDAVPVAGRELGLWVVKDLRRTAGALKGEMADALKAQEKHPGLAPFVELLQKATPADLDVLEKDLRAGVPEKKEEQKDDKKPAEAPKK